MVIISRSYKKTPWAGDNKGKDKKRMANKKIRSYLKQHPTEKIPQNFHKKYYETWDICDFGWTYTWEQYWESCVKAWREWGRSCGRSYPDKDEEYRRWLKYYKSK